MHFPSLRSTPAGTSPSQRTCPRPRICTSGMDTLATLWSSARPPPRSSGEHHAGHSSRARSDQLRCDRQRGAVCLAAVLCFQERPHHNTLQHTTTHHNTVGVCVRTQLQLPQRRASCASLRPHCVGRSTAFPFERARDARWTSCGRPATRRGQGQQWDDTPERWGLSSWGQSLRVTGAQRLATLGVEVAKIMVPA